jgi:hypothetical protein
MTVPGGGRRSSGWKRRTRVWGISSVATAALRTGGFIRRSASQASSAAGALGQVALGQGLQPPGDPLDQPRPVVRGCLLAEHLGVLGPQLLDGHPLQGGDLFSDVQVHVRSYLGVSETVNQRGH